MTDSRLQQLKRAWEASGSVEDETAYLRELVRVGELSEDEFARRSWKQSVEDKLELLRASVDEQVLIRLEDGTERLLYVAEVEEPGPHGPNHRFAGAFPLSRWRAAGFGLCVVVGLCALLGCPVSAILSGVGVWPVWAPLVFLPVTVFGAYLMGFWFASPAHRFLMNVEDLPPIKAKAVD